MTRSQIATICSFLVLFLLLFFGFKTKPKKLLEEERTRQLNMQRTNIAILQQEAFDVLSKDNRSRIQILQSRIDMAEDTLLMVELLKEMSGTWFDLGRYSLAGHYAEQIAQVENTDEAWGIAGTTYALGADNLEKEKERLYCRDKSIEALERAITLDPENVDHQLNRAVVLATHPDPANPMKGIQLLLSLNKKYPKNVPVMNNLARFALQTNQLDRAVERLTTALELDPQNQSTICLLAEVYARKGDLGQRDYYQEKCNRNK